MDIINIINNIQLDNQNQINLFIENCDINNLPIVGLEQLYPIGFPKGQSAVFYGDTESGKSLLSLNLVDKNPNLMFAYVDTHMQIHNHFNNMLLIRTNLPSDILSFFRDVNENLVDIIILDDLSYLITEGEVGRSTELATFLSNLYRICVAKNIALILLNTINGEGNMYMSESRNIYYNSNSIVRLYQTSLNEDNITISGIIEKSRYSNRNSIFVFEAERM